MREKNQEQLLKEIAERIQQIRSYTPRVGVFGNSGVGKSSLCNALFGRDIAKISDVEACTREPQEIFVGAKDSIGGIKLVDVPGIGEDPKHQEEYTALYKSLAPELDLVLWAIKADDRNYASGLEAFTTVFDEKKAPPVVFVITQADKTANLRDWDYSEYRPGASQILNIEKKESDVASRFKVSRNSVISISVEVEDEKLTGKSYNLKPLVSRVVEALPNGKKYSFTREAKEENVTSQARENAEKGIWDSVKQFAGEAWESLRDKAADALIASAPRIISSLFKSIRSWF